MRIIIYLYYLCYIICGGYWHYQFSLVFYKNNIGSDILLATQVTEAILMLLAFAILFKPLHPILHLYFFVAHLLLDIYFLNYVKFESSNILTQFIPLFFFLLSNKKFVDYTSNITYGLMLFISIGFISSGISKINSGWINPNDLVIHSYVLQFNNGFGFDTLLGKPLLSHIHLLLWKILDYATLILELSFGLVFIKKNSFVIISFLAVVFHIMIFFTLRLGAFYPFILCYALVVKQLNSKSKEVGNSVLYPILASVLLLLFLINKLNPNFVFYSSPTSVYIYSEYAFNAVAVVLYLKEFIVYFKSTKVNRSILNAHE